MMIKEAALHYGDGGAEDIRNGTRSELLENSDANDLLKVLQSIAKRFLYPADKVQSPFLAGLKVTRGILDEYNKFLLLSREQFAFVRSAWRSADRLAVSAQQLETLLPLLDRLPAHYLDVYDSALKDRQSMQKWGDETWEWFCRAHLIVDYLSGMTDDFAYRAYQVISGAELE
jgi:dGTPase